MKEFDLTPEEMQLFFEEANEQLETMEQVLLRMEQNPDDAALVQELFRAAHTLKGGAATVGLETVARLTHAVETLLDAVRQGQARLTDEITDKLLTGVDAVRRLLEAAERGDGEELDGSLDLEELIRALEQGAVNGSSPVTSTSGPAVHRWLIQIDPSTPLASVRSYQALMILEDYGEIIEQEPPQSVIEDPDQDVDRLTVLLATPANPEEIQLRLYDGVPDLQSAEWSLVEPAGSGAQASVTTSQDTAQGSAETPSGEPASVQGSGARAAGASVISGMDRSVRVDVGVLDRLMNLVGELVIDRTRLTNLSRSEADVATLREGLEQLSGHLSRITSELQDTIMRARMMPVQMLFRKFPRMVRDLSRQLNKPVNFQLEGEETELDRSVIEQLGDPLIHLLRNALDHGLESPEERRAAGKPPEGRLRLSAFHQESHIYVQVEDDGRGIDPARIRRSAIAKGIITEEQAERLGPDDSLDLIFAPGFSTAAQVSTVSGRGVGLDVVRRNVERVGGTVTVRSTVGQGTTFTIKLPLTLAILQALMVEIGETVYAIPLASVVEAVRVGSADIHPVHGWEMIRIRDQTIPLLDPGAVWGDAARVRRSPAESSPVVVVQAGSAPFGLLVDRLVGEEEIVIKSLGALIGEVPGISGASILGDGSVALIVDAASLEKELRQLA